MDLLTFINSTTHPTLIAVQLSHEFTDLTLIIVAFFVATLAIKASIDSYYSVVELNNSFVRITHLFISGSCLGSGIWCMHFYLMLAISLPIPFDFDFTVTTYTFVTIIMSSVITLALLSSERLIYKISSPIVLAAGIIFMHYAGMEAITFKAQIVYQVSYFGLSILSSFLAATTFCFMLTKYYSKDFEKSLPVAIIISMTVSISVFITHELGMLSSLFIPDDSIADLKKTIYSPIQYSLFIASSFVIFLSCIAIFTQKLLTNSNIQITKAKLLLGELRSSRAKLKSLAYYDPLTSLQNRRSLFESMQNCIRDAHKTNSSFIVLFLDIDNFKIINDTLGHSVGDEMLTVIANRLKLFATVPTDISRFGGDEFVLIIHDHLNSLSGIIEEILNSICQPILLESYSYRTSASIGGCIYPKDGETADELLLCADLALYRAKSLGKNQMSFFDKSLKEELEFNVHLKEHLDKAIDDKNIQVYYQPIVNAQTGDIEKLEALCRWKLNGEFINPEKFINVAEQFNLINKLGLYIIDLAFKDAATIKQNFHKKIRVAINLSASQFTDSNLVNFISETIIKYNLPATLISLEITESSIAKNIDHAVYQLKKLKKLGISVSIDDFGTGYSSLGHLQKLPIDTLKLDRSFVVPLPESFDASIIAETVMILANKLNLEVIVEGVENEQQLDFFNQYRGVLIQGYYFYKPMPIIEVMTTLRKFTVEFKLECIELITTKGYPLKQAADVMNVADTTLKKWLRHHNEETIDCHHKKLEFTAG